MHKVVRKMLWGILARVVNMFVPCREKHWVLGSDYGNMYREGSKYLLEYIIKEKKAVLCTFVTQNPEVYNTLQERGIPCVMNFSWKGILAIAQADAVFTTQYTNDILYTYRKKNRSFYYMVHGQSYKKGYDLARGAQDPKTLKQKLREWYTRLLLVGYDIHEVSFMPVTSDYVGDFMSQCFSRKVPMKVIGMPRNDGLFDDELMKQEKWVTQAKGKTVITYMPTHRQYGAGELSPIPFLHDAQKRQWLKEHGIILLVKQHPNMIHKIEEPYASEELMDISKLPLDPMAVIYNTDLLITDYSSVWMDFLLMKKPILFHFYDDFTENDTDMFFSVKDIASEYCCYNEEQLFGKIKELLADPTNIKMDNNFIAKFHKYPDGKSCERYYEAVMKDKYGE